MTRLYSSISVETTLAAGINTTQTTMTVPSSAAANLLLGGETLAAGNVDIFTVVIDPDTVNEEVVYVTDVSNDTLTISRGQAGTGTAGVSGIAHSAGATVRHVLTSADLDYFRDGLPASIFTTKGDIVAATAAGTASRLAVGTNGQALVANSAAATGLAWTTLTGAPKIAQVVSSSLSLNTTTTSTTYVDVTNFNASITPTSASSKVVVIFDFTGYMSGAPSTIPVTYYQIVRGSTGIYTDAQLGLYGASYTSDITTYPRQTLVYVDSPNTTSSTTYKLQVRGNNGNVAGATGGAATVVLMEVLV